MLNMFAVCVAAVLASNFAVAADFQLQSLDIKEPFVRATPPGARTAGVHMTIANKGNGTDRLLSAASPVAGIVEIHEMKMDGAVMRMHAVAGIEIQPGASVEFQPGGYHIMLMDLKQPLRAGEFVPLTLNFEKSGSVEVKAAIESMGAVRTN